MLVKITGKKNEEVLTTTSRQVAEVFNKDHKHVLRDIEKRTEPNFGLSEEFRALKIEFTSNNVLIGIESLKKIYPILERCLYVTKNKKCVVAEFWDEINKAKERTYFMKNELQLSNYMTPIEIALEIDDKGMTTARKLYDFLELAPNNYSRWCKVNILENEFAEDGTDFYSSQRKSKGRGNFAEDFKLTASFAKKLSMTQKNEKGEQARQYFLGCEEGLKRVAIERNKWEIERAKGIVIRHILTDTIKMKVADSPHKKFMYPNYTKLIYKTLFGKSMRELQEEFKVKGNESIREYLTADQLKEVESMEMLVSSLINCGWGYDQIKDFIHVNSIKQIAV